METQYKKKKGMLTNRNNDKPSQDIWNEMRQQEELQEKYRSSKDFDSNAKQKLKCKKLKKIFSNRRNILCLLERNK